MITFIKIAYLLPLVLTITVMSLTLTFKEVSLKHTLQALLISVIPVANILFLLFFFVGTYGLYTGKIMYNEETKVLKVLKKKRGN